MGGRGARAFIDPASANTVLPAGAANFFRRRLQEAVGVGLFAAAVVLLASILTYTPGDPSLNSAGSGDFGNLLGPGGAMIGDLALQVFGFASLLPALVMVVWSWRMITKQGLSVWWLRLMCLIFAMLFLATGLNALTVPENWPLMTRLGGVSGALIFAPLADFGGLFGLSPGYIAAIVAISAAALLIPSLGLSWQEWRGAARAVVHGILLLGHGAKRSREVFGIVPAWRSRQDDNDEDNDWNEADHDGAVEIDPVPVGLNRAATGASEKKSLSRTGLVAEKKPRLKAGRKAAAERQGKLALDANKEYQTPPLDFLDSGEKNSRTQALNKDALQQNAKFLGGVLEDFGVKGEVVKVRPGPVVTLYELDPAPGTKTSRVIGLSDDIARSMSAVSVRIAVVPGQSVIGIELPNVTREMVHLGEILSSGSFEKSTCKLPLALGKDIGGEPVTVDLSTMPHLLIAGTTGSGKSVAMNTMILSLLYRLRPDECKFIMIDPKMLELSVYEGIPHLLTPVVTEPSKAIVALKWTVREMEDRYRAMSQMGVRNISGYNARLAEARKKGEELTRVVQTGFDEDGKPVMEDQPLDMNPLPFIVVVVDEMADLMLVAGKDVEAAIQRLAQMARAAGIHLMMATQRPSVDVITGTIKANFPTRISFQVTSKIDSRTILGEQGAEQLLGQGDMLYMAGGGRISRVHGPFVSDEEVERVVGYLKSQGTPEYIEEVVVEDTSEDGPGGGGKNPADALYDEAVALIAREGKASTSFIQRHLQIGYNRAARIIEQMEKEQVVSPANRVGRREVLISHHGG
ncbi:MAG: cell division protein FtsK [Alphaproteobacteria bacterium]|nr:cell division protein FtsK [Alphaproteobacteria bacterium]MBT7942900.1 cell division protein FtsK [Alphaproteobacteria bacterium]